MNVVVKKSSSSKSVSAKILKQSAHINVPPLTSLINHSLHENTFSGELKQSEVIPLCKKIDLLKKENYRPIGLLPHALKVFGRILYKQLFCINYSL